jgi:hypothetical protein
MTAKPDPGRIVIIKPSETLVLVKDPPVVKDQTGLPPG